MVGGKLIGRVIVKQRLESGEEVNAANTWKPFSVQREQVGPKLKAGLGRVATSWPSLRRRGCGEGHGEQGGADTGHH